MRTMLSLVGVYLCVWACACGGGTGTTNAVDKSPSFHPARTGQTTLSFGVAHDVKGLMGDEDDDDDETQTEGTKPNGDSDNDTDNDASDNARLGFFDRDDGATVSRGHEADAHDARVLSVVVERYYQAASMDDGERACAEMAPSFARTIPETYGRAPGPAYLRGATTCAAVMSKLFKREWQESRAARRVVDVRIDRGEAFVLLGSPTAPAGIAVLKRVSGGWKLAGMGAGSLP